MQRYDVPSEQSAQSGTLGCCWQKLGLLLMVSLNTNGYGLQAQTITAYMCISNLARSQPPRVFPNTLDWSLQLSLQPPSITASECISTFTRSQCGATVELDGRLPIINIPLLLAWFRSEFMRKIGSSCKSIEQGWEDMNGYPVMMNHTHCVDLWTLGKSVWGSAQTKWIYDAWQECMRPRAGKDWVGISYNERMPIYPGVSKIHIACRWVHLRYPCISKCIYIERLRKYMPYYDVANLVTVIKTNMIDEMPCGCETLRTTGERIQHKVACRARTEVSAAFEVSCRPAQRSQLLQNLAILIVKSRSILNASSSLQVLSAAHENTLAESQSTFQSSRGAGSIWKYLEAPARGTGVSGRFGSVFRTELHFANGALYPVHHLLKHSRNADRSQSTTTLPMQPPK